MSLLIFDRRVSAILFQHLWDSGLGFRFQDSGFKIQGECLAEGVGCMGLRVGAGEVSKVQGVGCRV